MMKWIFRITLLLAAAAGVLAAVWHMHQREEEKYISIYRDGEDTWQD